MNLRSCKRFMPRTRILDHVQTAVDAQHHLIVAHDVTNVGTTAINSRTWRVRPSPPWASRRSMSRPTATTSRARRFRGRLSLSGRPASDLALHVGGEGKATVEHPFGTLKARIGATHFKTTRKGRNRDEPPRSDLQSEARDRHPGCRDPDDARLRPRLKSSCYSASPSKSDNRKPPAGQPSAFG
jgi:hypothetical protein